MLHHLSIHNYAIAERIDLELHSGMTVVTGETGAGKSIMLDALGLTLGDRADAGAVRPGAERADILASFDLSQIPHAQRWLAERELNTGDECVLRRTISKEGRSRSYINGRPVTLQDLKALGDLLVDIHSQHAHQSLLKKSTQQRLLDAFAGLQKQSQSVRQLAQQWQQCNQRYQQLLNQNEEQRARIQLLSYQSEELDALSLTLDELTELEEEQKTLANAEQILGSSHQALELCRDGEQSAQQLLQLALQSIHKIDNRCTALSEAEQMLQSALIQTEEAASELQHYLDDVELNPARLQEVEERLSTIYEIARKHKIQPTELPDFHASLTAELEQLEGSDQELEALEQERQQLLERYQTEAQTLSKKRQQAADKLTKQVEKQLAQLSMGNCRFSAALNPKDSGTPSSTGLEEIEYLIATHPAAPLQPLNKIASGGELSRISLAIQVITAKTSAIPTLVFDEVDVGIGGATAEIVGQLLSELGERGQILCITHQTQVAAQGDQHLKVSKQQCKNSLTTSLQSLSQQERVEELARMMGGVEITEQTLAHAKEMLQGVAL